MLLMFVSLLYMFQVKSNEELVFRKLTATYTMYIIVGLEMVVAVPCLIYYFSTFAYLRVFVCVGGI